MRLASFTQLQFPGSTAPTPASLIYNYAAFLLEENLFFSAAAQNPIPITVTAISPNISFISDLLSLNTCYTQFPRYALGILSLIAAPQNPTAIIATATAPIKNFFIGPILSFS